MIASFEAESIDPQGDLSDTGRKTSISCTSTCPRCASSACCGIRRSLRPSSATLYQGMLVFVPIHFALLPAMPSAKPTARFFFAGYYKGERFIRVASAAETEQIADGFLSPVWPATGRICSKSLSSGAAATHFSWHWLRQPGERGTGAAGVPEHRLYPYRRAGGTGGFNADKGRLPLMPRQVDP